MQVKENISPVIKT